LHLDRDPPELILLWLFFFEHAAQSRISLLVRFLLTHQADFSLARFLHGLILQFSPLAQAHGPFFFQASVSSMPRFISSAVSCSALERNPFLGLFSISARSTCPVCLVSLDRTQGLRPGLDFCRPHILVAMRLWVDFLRGPFSAHEKSSSGQLFCIRY
jgi:hypothetical protein